MKRLVIFGSSSFIATHFIKKVLQHNIQIIGLYRKNDWIKHPNYTSHRIDFIDSTSYTRYLHPNDIVFDFISSSVPSSSVENPIQEINAQIHHHARLFQVASDLKVSRILFMSSGGGIYGDSEKYLHDEDDPLHPKSPHAITKLASEHYLEYFCNLADIDYTICRITNPYGPGQAVRSGFGLIPNLISELKKGIRPKLYGYGELERDYIYIDVLVEMLYTLLTNKPRHHIYNLGSGILRSNLEVFHIISAKLKTQLKPTLVEPRVFDVKKSGVSMHRYFEEFGKSYNVSELKMDFI